MKEVYLDKTKQFVCLKSDKFIGTYDINLKWLKRDTQYWKNHLFEKNWFDQDYWNQIEKIIYENQ
ncbi:MAG: hypothetical protein RLZZ546_2156 [Bacteroidota bacterium]|jgi:uncharacterized protein involved in tellurium resistance